MNETAINGISPKSDVLGMFNINVDYLTFESIREKGHRIIIVPPNDFWNSRVKRQYNLMRICNGFMKGDRYLIAEYDGYQIAKWDHRIRVSSAAFEIVNEGDLVLKVGKIITEGRKN